MCAQMCVSESRPSYSEVVEAEGVGLVLEDVVAESSEDTSQQHRYQDGRHCAAGMGVASAGMVGRHLGVKKTKKTTHKRDTREEQKKDETLVGNPFAPFPSLPHSLPHSLTPFLTSSLPHSLPPSLSHSIPSSLPHSL